ncbi:MAG: hypothetical protein ACP5U1_08570 [Desulfomonilaceae bacterium]
MKTLGVFLSLAFFCLGVAGATFAAEPQFKGEPVKRLKVNYNEKYQCVMVCKGQKPTLEALEDGLAYALDIPLALMSPVTAPVVSSLLDKYDNDPDRSYYGRSPQRRR